MAIGLGKIFGFEFQENFNYPYFAGTIKEFWRRWHISLSQFFRDYVYIPLGGNQCSECKWVINILIVWFLTGMWHGASWNYIIWGFCYGVLLLAEHYFLDKLPKNRAITLIRRVLTMIVVIVLWVVFKCENNSVLIKYIGNMFWINMVPFVDKAFIYQAKNFIVLILVSALFSVPLDIFFRTKITNDKIYKIVATFFLCIGVISSVSYIYMGSYNPFLYFMF